MRHRQQGRAFRAWLRVEQLEDRNLLSAGGLGNAPVAEAAFLPNDPNFGTQYALNNTGQSNGKVDADLDAPEAWDVTIGSTKNVVALVDTGIDYRHPDLYLNVWLNQGEIPSAIRGRLADVDRDGLITFRDLNDPRNQGAGKITDVDRDGRITAADVLKPAAQGGWADGVSNDGDRYVDDLVGWNFLANTNNPLDDNGHGSHVAGIVGATGNNGAGVAGLNWSVQLMALKFLNASSTGTLAGAAEAMNYAVAHGAFVANNSWSSQGASYQPLADAIDNARRHGVIYVAAAGNGGDDRRGDNLDASPSYPASYNYDNVVAVAATDRRDGLTAYSNYGARTVDLAAPGQDILSTWTNGRYVTTSGTSMAAPMVTGTLALVRAVHPDWGYARLINQVTATVDKLPALAGKVASGGRVNAARAVGAPAAATSGARASGTPAATASGLASGARATFNEAPDAGTITTDGSTTATPQSTQAREERTARTPVSPAVSGGAATPAADCLQESDDPVADYFNLPEGHIPVAAAGQWDQPEETSVRVAGSVADTPLDRGAVDHFFAVVGGWPTVGAADEFSIDELFASFAPAAFPAVVE